MAMKMPNGYGSVVNLGKGRRKPYAIRITTGTKKNDKGGYVQTYKYLEYFATQKEALIYLANYNEGTKVKEHISLTSQPTFSEVYNRWIAYKNARINPIGSSTLRNYNLAYNWYSELHNRKFATLKTKDIQDVIDKYTSKSQSTVMTMRTVLNQMYAYAIKHNYVEKNYSDYVDYEYTKGESVLHKSFTEDEIKLLWDNVKMTYVDYVLMMIYTGLRPSEFVSIENKNVHLKERYFRAGMKTEAGTNRIIPISIKVLPFFEKYYSSRNKYLITNPDNKKYSYGVFNNSVWRDVIKRLNMNHTPHDTRHTFATLMDRAGANTVCTKLIIGHAISDLTKGTYTHKSLDDLINSIDLL